MKFIVMIVLVGFAGIAGGCASTGKILAANSRVDGQLLQAAMACAKLGTEPERQACLVGVTSAANLSGRTAEAAASTAKPSGCGFFGCMYTNGYGGYGSGSMGYYPPPYYGDGYVQPSPGVAYGTNIGYRTR